MEIVLVTVTDLCNGDTFALPPNTRAAPGPEDWREWVERHDGAWSLHPSGVPEPCELGALPEGSIAWVYEDESGVYWLSRL